MLWYFTCVCIRRIGCTQHRWPSKRRSPWDDSVESVDKDWGAEVVVGGWILDAGSVSNPWKLRGWEVEGLGKRNIFEMMIDVWRLTQMISCDVMSRRMLQNTIFLMRNCYIEFRVVAFSKVVPDGWSILLQVSYPSSTPVRGVWGFWDCDIPMAGRATKWWECIGLAGRGLARIEQESLVFFLQND